MSDVAKTTDGEKSTSMKIDQALSAMSIKVRIFLLCLVPFVGVLFFAGQGILSSWEKSTEYASIEGITNRVPTLFELVHEMQRERGMSAGFLNSGGSNFKDTLPGQRTATDQAFAAVNEAYRPDVLAKLPAATQELINEVRGNMTGLASMRGSIDGLGVPTPEMASFFTSTINNLLHVTEKAASTVSDGFVVDRLVAIGAIQQVKERAGLERATGTGMASRGIVDKVGFVNLISLEAEEKALSMEFRNFAPAEVSRFYEETLSEEATATLNSYREIFRDSAIGAPVTEFTATEWFQATTEEIDLLKEVADFALVELQGMTGELLAGANSDALFEVIMTLVIIVVTLIVAFFSISSVLGPMGRLTATMRIMAEGDFSKEVTDLDNRDELGEMSRAVQIFRENGLRVAEMTEEEAARLERNRVERAEMMQELQAAFGEVVDAAVAGDFSKRVTAEFPDAELNALGASVNNLVETVDTGVSESGEVLSALADMDLTQRVVGEYQGAFLKLKDDTNAVADKLSDVVGQLRETSRGVKSATGEILAGANDLSERTTKQAATIEETSAAMEQLATTVMENVQKAQDASSSSQEVSKTAEDGADVMHQANEAMERITSSSAKISNIIGMIDDIAFQTNLLALNASVEAARAGEAGKGFAVVAIEVRRLAQSAADASSEVKQLIEQSTTEVDGGSKLVSSAAEKLTSMLEAARKSNALMDSIANESREQASAIDEVNVAVRQMDEMTQHNAALVEETNAAIEQTEAQASELDRIVEVFKLEGTSAPNAKRAAA